ncbi:NAD-dependent epimerase/dehydratase family protein [Aerococcus viridans]|uniref:NAD-dependent epimerase/dehydratase family protein n=1 Tax=Aerococcus viridans TaxID=1377 RepID=UPI003AA7F5A5
MKKILITGQNSYIGNQFENWISSKENEYKIEKISVRDNAWENMDWSCYDTILHVAGIAHNSSDSNLEDLYYQVNRDLTTEIAKKAKDDGVSHFVNMSSIIVFGAKNSRIDKDTQPNPDNFYGDSKLQAEINLDKLADKNFVISHIRPPMVYGAKSKGNFPLLAKLANRTPIFPNYNNKRSMIYIKNLCEFLRIVIDKKISGRLHPQNSEYVKTSKLVSIIARNQHHIVLETKLFNPFIKISLKVTFINKIFGDLYYSMDMSDIREGYQNFNLEESIEDIYVQK